MSEGRITANLLCLVVFWVAIWISGRLSGITKLSPLLYYLLIGCILGNFEIGFLDLHHSQFLKTFSVVAIAIVFFALGLEENVDHFMGGIKKAWGIALIGALVPFFIGLFCTWAFWPETGLMTALMGGLAVTATAVSLTMIALKAEGLATSRPAIGIMTSAVLDDIGSLASVAIMVPIATGESAVSVIGIGLTLGKAAGFFCLVAIGHKVIMPKNIEGAMAVFGKIGMQDCLQYQNGAQATLVAIFVAMCWGVLAVFFGFHPAIGCYMGGLIMEEHYFDHPKGNTYHEVLHHVETVAYGWMGPFFFLELGSMILIEMEMLMSIWWMVLVFYVLLFIGQFVSAAGAAKYVPGGFDWCESAMIGFGMMGRAELFFVVLELCYVQHDIMTKEIVVAFSLVAMLMNISVPVCITLYKPYFMKHTTEVFDENDPKEDHHGAEKHGVTKQIEEEREMDGKYVGNGGGGGGRYDPRLKDTEGIDIHVDESDSEYEDDHADGQGQQNVAAAPPRSGAQAKAKSPGKRAGKGTGGIVMPSVCGCLAEQSSAPPARFNS